MKIKLIKENKAPLLARKRLTFEIDYPGSKTPSKDEIKKTIATLQKVKEELIAVRHIYQKFGKNQAKIIAHFYSTLKDLERYEPKSKKEEKKEEKKVESTPAEKPKVEEKKEEKKVESTPAEKPQEEKSNAKEESKEQKTK